MTRNLIIKRGNNSIKKLIRVIKHFHISIFSIRSNNFTEFKPLMKVKLSSIRMVGKWFQNLGLVILPLFLIQSVILCANWVSALSSMYGTASHPYTHFCFLSNSLIYC
jgi:hypothetical protein